MANADGLTRMNRLLESLGHPEKNFKVIHIAGTNGKGSTAVMIASILEEAGYSVGLYISPHLESYCERIQIWDGTHRMIARDNFEKLMARLETFPGLTLFEKLTGTAYLFFAEEKPDYIILECGLGGRLDSTNTISKPLVSVITQVGMDHTDILGKTIIKIAREKAGIIKPGVPLVSQTMDLIVKNILSRTAKEIGCEFIDVSFKIDQYRKYKLGMKGKYQLANAATAVEAIRAACIKVTEEAIEKGLQKAVYPGRFEILDTEPYWIIDGAHNPDAIQNLTETYSVFAKENNVRRTLLVFGCMKDKNYNKMIRILTENLRGCTFSTVNIDDERAEDSVTLGKIFTDRGRSCTCYESVEEAITDANTMNFESILATGSIYLAGAVREYFNGERNKNNV
ncbi:MAG TPA: bifunctional folylpolyglutamate synthase/dihydrofolate synthase [Mogibacterium sp.]|nr:bifunctional folylpolyglutamate synthase/dihydrofolate synthase [Mogibacterium sp.]